jgi:hypothetical protein
VVTLKIVGSFKAGIFPEHRYFAEQVALAKAKILPAIQANSEGPIFAGFALGHLTSGTGPMLHANMVVGDTIW